MGAGGIIAGFKATSICTIRREPGFKPIGGVTARDVTCQTGVVVGVSASQVVVLGVDRDLMLAIPANLVSVIARRAIHILAQRPH